jgi:hypothetical protein
MIVQEFGNIINVKYVCPMGVRHKGEGYCKYTGHYKVGHFHGTESRTVEVLSPITSRSPVLNVAWVLLPCTGEGEFVCQDGRSYVGEWMEGKRHGKVCNYQKQHRQLNFNGVCYLFS